MEDVPGTVPPLPEVEAQRTPFRSALRWLPLVGVLIALVLFYALGLQAYFSLSEIRRHQAELTAFVANNLPLAALTYVLVYIAAVTISLPVAGIMTITGGFLFGTVLGATLAAFSATVGAIFIFLIARSSFGELMLRRAGPRVERLRRGFLDEGFSYLLFLRLVPLFPFILINLAAALFAMRLLPYAAATAIGAVPPSFVFAFLGAGLGSAVESEHGPMSTKLIAALALLGVMALLPALVRRLRRGRRSGLQREA